MIENNRSIGSFSTQLNPAGIESRGVKSVVTFLEVHFHTSYITLGNMIKLATLLLHVLSPCILL